MVFSQVANGAIDETTVRKGNEAVLRCSYLNLSCHIYFIEKEVPRPLLGLVSLKSYQTFISCWLYLMAFIKGKLSLLFKLTIKIH